MARAQSPIAKRLKALAQRAGLPVDDQGAQPQDASQPSAGAPPREPDGAVPVAGTPADDEQPTGDFPAVPDPGEQPTGDVPVVSLDGEAPPEAATPAPTAVPVDEPAPAPGAARAPEPEQPRPAQTGYVVPPIWMDPAPETGPAEPHVIQPPFAEPTPGDVDAGEMFAAGPTLSPPVIPPRPLEPLVPHTTDASSFPASTPEPEVDAYALEPAALGEVQAPSMATELGDALALPDDELEPAAETPSPSEPTLPSGEDQPTLVNPVLSAVPDPEPVTEPDSTAGPDSDADLAAGVRATVDDDAPALVDGTPDPEPNVPAGRTGRFAGLRKRVRPGASAPTVAAEAVPEPDPAPVALPDPPAPEPSPGLAPAAMPATGAVLAQPLAALPAKPSFAERAALRRRARTLRARRDAGLLELGAIVLDLRRFGDPTAGALQRRRTDELADLDNEISAIEQVIERDSPSTAVAQLGTVRCASCDALVGPSDRFCAHCGTPRPDGSAPAGASPVQ